MNLGDIASWAASVATVIAAAAVVVTAVIYQRQLDAMTKARQLESLVLIMKYSEDLKLRKAGYFMFEHAAELRRLFDVPFSWESRKSIDDRVRAMSAGEFGIIDVDRSLDALNNVCFLIRQGYAPVEAVDAFLKNSLVHAWHVFGPYALHRRQRASVIADPSSYAIHLEWVVRNVCGLPRSTERLPITGGAPTVKDEIPANVQHTSSAKEPTLQRPDGAPGTESSRPRA